MLFFCNRGGLGLLAVFLSLLSLQPAQVQAGEPLRIESLRVPFHRYDPQARQLGRIVWRGGLELSASSPAFGGWSGLHVSPDGRSLTAVSDQGAWLTATVEYDADGNLAGLSGARLGPLLGLDGKPVPGRIWADAEALARLPDASWLVSFERNHRLWRYVTWDDRAVAVEGPAEIARQSANAGIKSLAATATGQLVALSQSLSQQADTVVGWIGTPADGMRYKWQKFSYAVSADFRPVDMATLPDGSFVVLEYAFDATHGARTRLVLVAADQIKPDAVVRGTELAVIARPYNIEKYDAISVTRGRRGETLIWLLSDDDFNPLQRNLLLQLELSPA